MNKLSKVLMIVVAVIVVGGIGTVLVTQKSSQPRQVNGQLVGDNSGEQEIITSEVDTSNWQTYRNEEFGFEFRYKQDWSTPQVVKDGVRTSVLFGPNTNITGIERGLYLLEIYLNKNKPKYYIFDQQCEPDVAEVCIATDPYQYLETKRVVINNLNAHVSQLGDMLPMNYIFIEGRKDGYLFQGPTEDKNYYAVVLSFKEIERAVVDYCLTSPRVTDSGREIYPTNLEKYGDIGDLGELFTASDCGNDRLMKVFGVQDDNYTLWPDLGLINPPSREFLSLLKEIGFEKGDTCNEVNENQCKHWSLKKTVTIDEILELKEFTKEIKSSGCLNCG